MASDRLESDTIVITHEFLSFMLGVRRTGVTAIARDLRRAGLVEYRHGRIGLSICHAIIGAHNGRLWADPDSGDGTVFRMTFPTASIDEAADV